MKNFNPNTPGGSVYMVPYGGTFYKDYYFIPTKWWLWYWFALNVFVLGKPYETFSGENMAPVWGSAPKEASCCGYQIWFRKGVMETSPSVEITHTAWVGLCPVYLFDVDKKDDEGGLGVVSRNWWLDPWLTINEFLFTTPMLGVFWLVKELDKPFTLDTNI